MLKTSTLLLLALIFHAGTASAVTVTWDGDAADGALANPINWSDDTNAPLRTAGNDGIIPAGFTIDLSSQQQPNLDITQNGSTVQRAGQLEIEGNNGTNPQPTLWTITDGILQTTAGNLLVQQNATLTIQGTGQVNAADIFASQNASVTTVDAPGAVLSAGNHVQSQSNGSTIIVNDGTVTAGNTNAGGDVRSLNNSTFTVNGGLVRAVGDDVRSDLGSTFNVNGGIVEANDDIVAEDTSTFNVAGGLVNPDDDFFITQTGTVNVSGTGNITAGDSVFLGNNNAHAGTMNLSGGSVNAANNVIVRDQSTLNLSGTGAAVAGLDVRIQENATLNMTGGSITANGPSSGADDDGFFTQQNAVANISAGTVSAPTARINLRNTSTLNLSGTGAMTAADLLLQETATLNATGGTITLSDDFLQEDGSALVVDGSIITAGDDVIIGNGNGLEDGTAALRSGEINANDSFRVQEEMTLDITGGIARGNATGNSGETTIDNDATVNVSGGEMTSNSRVFRTRQNGELNISGTGNVNTGSGTNDDFRMENTSTLNVSGGSLTANRNVLLGNQAGGAGTATLSGGTINAGTNLNVQNAATFNVDGGVATAARDIRIQNDSTLNMTGGSLVANGTATDSSDGFFTQQNAVANISGGTVSAASSRIVLTNDSTLNLSGTGAMDASDVVVTAAATLNITDTGSIVTSDDGIFQGTSVSTVDNGGSITLGDDLFIRQDGLLRIRDGNVVANNSAGGSSEFRNNGKLEFMTARTGSVTINGNLDVDTFNLGGGNFLVDFGTFNTGGLIVNSLTLTSDATGPAATTFQALVAAGHFQYHGITTTDASIFLFDTLGPLSIQLNPALVGGVPEPSSVAYLLTVLLGMTTLRRLRRRD